MAMVVGAAAHMAMAAGVWRRWRPTQSDDVEVGGVVADGPISRMRWGQLSLVVWCRRRGSPHT